MTTKEGVAASRRRGKSLILSPKFVTEARPGRVDVPCYARPITVEYKHVDWTNVVTSHCKF